MVGVVFRASGPPVFRCSAVSAGQCSAAGGSGGRSCTMPATRASCDLGLGSDEVFLAMMARGQTVVGVYR